MPDIDRTILDTGVAATEAEVKQLLRDVIDYVEAAIEAGTGYTIRGDYDNGTTYQRLDVVYDQAASWVYIHATPASGNPPPTLPVESDSRWQLQARSFDTLLEGLDDVEITAPTDLQLLTYDSGDEKWKNVTPGAVDVAAAIVAASAKATPVDADSFGIVDSADANVLKEITYAQLKTALKTYIETVHVHKVVAAELEEDSTTLQNILSFDIGAGETWHFTTALYMSKPANVAKPNSFKFQISGPASPSSLNFWVEAPGGSEAGTATTLYDTNIFLPFAITDLALKNTVRFYGYIVNGANAGTVTIKYAQRVLDSSAAGIMKVRKGSFLDAWRMA